MRSSAYYGKISYIEYPIAEWNSYYNRFLNNRPYGNSNPLCNKYYKLLPAPRALKVQGSDNFDRTWSKFTHFHTRLALVFASDPDRDDQDAAKIAYAVFYLTGTAADWFKPQLDKTTGTVDFDNYATFSKVLKNAYDDLDARATTERKLRALKKRNKDYLVYHAEFATYAIVLNYDNLTKRSLLTEGAYYGLKDALSYQISLPENFDEFI